MEGFWKFKRFLFVTAGCFFLMLMASACSSQPQRQADVVTFDSKEQIPAANESREDVEHIAAVYRESCKESAQTDPVQNLIERLGADGYAAVDSENQLDMTNADQVLSFCRAVDESKTAELTIIEVIADSSEKTGTDAVGKQNSRVASGFRKYDFHTENGKVNIVRGYYGFDRNGNFLREDTVSYPADLWQYTEEGYLVFAGSWYADDYYIISLADEPEHAALRVAPLDAACRDLYQKYILPVGYENNNLFLVNWREEDLKNPDFAGLDFYDLFDRFYPMVYQRPVPYTASENPGVGFVYRIEESEFEDVIRTYLNVEPETLRSAAYYFPEDQSYEYKPRGFYEAGCSNMPYPEVAGYSANADGTITLTVNAVFSYEGTSKAFTHEVVIRPLENGSFHYVSNQITGGEYDAWWRTERLTAQEWEEVYGGCRLEETGGMEDEPEADEALWYLPQAGECLLTETETDDLENAVLTAAEQVGEVYRDMEIEKGASYASDVKDFNESQCREVVGLLGKAGYVSVADNMNMQNYEKIEDFYTAYLQKRDAAVTVYDVKQDGLIGVLTFVYRYTGQGDKIQTYYIGIGWQEGGRPQIKHTLISDVAKMHLTEKGYFIYTYEEQIIHSDENQYLRVKPLPEKCREFTEEYIAGLSFVNYDAFVTNWDSSNVGEIMMPCMFGDIYRIDTGVNLKVEDDRIPAEVYERIMTTYFPVSKEQLRSNCGYDSGSDSYPYEMVSAVPHEPFGEVVDYSVNADGTITLSVEGVWIDYDSDCAFTSEIVVQPFADGTFRYLSNRISSETEEFAKVTVQP